MQPLYHIITEYFTGKKSLRTAYDSLWRKNTTLISGGKLARYHHSICSKYLGKPEKNRDREWGQKAQTKYIEK